MDAIVLVFNLVKFEMSSFCELKLVFFFQIFQILHKQTESRLCSQPAQNVLWGWLFCLLSKSYLLTTDIRYSTKPLRLSFMKAFAKTAVTITFFSEKGLLSEDSRTHIDVYVISTCLRSIHTIWTRLDLWKAERFRWT